MLFIYIIYLICLKYNFFINKIGENIILLIYNIIKRNPSLRRKVFLEIHNVIQSII